MLRYRVRLCIDKLFPLILNPRILGLRLKILVRQARCRVGANFYTEEVMNLENRMKVRVRVGAAASSIPRSGPQIGTPLCGLVPPSFVRRIWSLG